MKKLLVLAFIYGVISFNVSAYRQEDVQKVIEYLAGRSKDKNFQNADLSGARLNECNLQGINLSKANLEGTNFSNSHLEGVKFNDTKLHNACLEGAHLTKANFSVSTCSQTNFKKANLQGADFTCAMISNGTDFSNSNLEGALFVTTLMEKANFNDTNLKKAIFMGSSLKNSTFHDAHLEGSDFSLAKLNGVDFRSARCEDSKFNQADFCSMTSFFNTNLARAQLRGIYLDPSSKIALEHAVFFGADFTGSTITNIQIPKSTTIIGAKFNHCNLTGLGLLSINLRDVSFKNSNLTGARFGLVIFYNTDFSETTLDFTMIISSSSAIGDPGDSFALARSVKLVTDCPTVFLSQWIYMDPTRVKLYFQY